MTSSEPCPFYSLSNTPRAKKHDFKGPNAISKTQQHFKPETDINAIIAKAIATGEPPPFKPGGAYGDFSILTDYQTGLAMIQDAQEAFNGLPAKVRKRFDNDPGKLLAFLHDPANHAEGIELGFFEGPVEPPKVTVPPGGVITETLPTTKT